MFNYFIWILFYYPHEAMEIYRRWQLIFNRKPYQMGDSLMGGPMWKDLGVTDFEWLSVSVIFVMWHWKQLWILFPLLVYSAHENILSTGHTYICEWLGRWFLLSCIIFMNRKSTRIFFITQTDIKSNSIFSHKDRT